MVVCEALCCVFFSFFIKLVCNRIAVGYCVGRQPQYNRNKNNIIKNTEILHMSGSLTKYVRYLLAVAFAEFFTEGEGGLNMNSCNQLSRVRKIK